MVRWSSVLSPLGSDFETRFFAWLRSCGQLGGSAQPLALKGGRSNHVWRLPGDPGRVLKLFGASTANPMFTNEALREIASLSSLAGTGLVPRLVETGQFEDRDWVIYDHVAGQNWSRDAGHVAQLLGRLHDQPVPLGLSAGPDGSADWEGRGRKILELCAAETARDLLDLKPRGQVEPLGRAFFVHGDPVPGNLIEHDGTLTLIDWQCPVAGDPAEDLAIFTSPAMQLLYRGAPLSSAELSDFLSSYPDPAMVARFEQLRPWVHWCMAAYCLWRVERGQEEYRRAMDLELQALAVQSSMESIA